MSIMVSACTSRMPKTSKQASSLVLGPWLSIMLQISECVGAELRSSVLLPIIERLKAVGLLFFGLGIA